MLEKTILSIVYWGKKVIADIFYSYDGVGYYNLANGIIGSLLLKSCISRTTIESTIDMKFAYEL